MGIDITARQRNGKGANSFHAFKEELCKVLPSWNILSVDNSLNNIKCYICLAMVLVSDNLVMIKLIVAV